MKRNKTFIGWTHKDNFLKSDRLRYGSAVLFEKVFDDSSYVKVRVTRIKSTAKS